MNDQFYPRQRGCTGTFDIVNVNAEISGESVQVVIPDLSLFEASKCSDCLNAGQDPWSWKKGSLPESMAIID